MWLDTKNAVIHLVGGTITFIMSTVFAYYSNFLWVSGTFLDKVVYSIFPIACAMTIIQIWYAVLSLVFTRYSCMTSPTIATDAVEDDTQPYPFLKANLIDQYSYLHYHEGSPVTINDSNNSESFGDYSVV